METLSSTSLIKCIPTPIACLDTNLNFLNYSDQWSDQFVKNKIDITGKNFHDLFKELPLALKKALEESLFGIENENDGEQFYLLNGMSKWFKWKLIPWKNIDNILGGVMIYLEDITKQKKEIELSTRVLEFSKVGGWEVDLIKGNLIWTETTKKIHEVGPDFIPDLEKGIKFYKKGYYRDQITKLVSAGIEKGQPWDIELIIITAKGNEKWVRAKGETEMVNGKCIRIFGTFQDIHEKKITELRYNEANDRLKIATDAACIGVWDYDIIENTLKWDSQMYSLYGIKQNTFEGVYEAWEVTIHPEDKQASQLAIAQAISGEKEFDTEFRVKWPNGEIRHIKGIAKTERNNNGKAIRMIGCNWDITELKKTKLQLNKIEESFIETFDNSAAGMALVNLDGKLTKANYSFCESLGYTEQELLQLTFQEFTHPDDLTLDLALLQEIVECKRESYQLEKRYIHKKGHFVDVILTVTAQKDINGKVISFIGHIIDISSRTRTELQLKETLKRLNVATRVSSIGIWDYDLKTNIVSGNENMYNIYGIEKNAPNLLDAWIDRIHFDDKKRVKEEFRLTVSEGKPFNTKFKAIKPNGKTIYLISFGEAQKDIHGNIVKIIGSNLDITALRHSELKLERSNESFSEIFNNSAIGMAIVDKDNHWLKVNDSLSKSLGYTQSELQKMTILDITHPEDIDKSKFNLQNSLYSYQMEKRYFHKDGHIVHVLLAVTLVRDLNNKVSHSIAQILDLTDRIEAANRLNSLVEVTKEQNDSLMNFAHIVSHNLRSHSSNMTMLTNFITKEEDEKERIKLQGMIAEASESLSETVADLNDVVQIKTGSLDQLKSISLLNTIKHVQKSIRGLIEEEKAVIFINVEKSHFVNAVPSYLESIFLNLLTNSLKYKAADRKPKITINSTQKNDKIHITFKDNGQGIDLERHGDKIFGMYKTFHKHKDAKGIGLFITKNQIETMGGKIYIESEVGKYTTVNIELKKG